MASAASTFLSSRPGYATAAVQGESEVTAGVGKQVSAVEVAIAVHHEHRRGDVDGRQGDVDAFPAEG
ncbi:hypothetical protein ACFY4K_34495 [Streptomyces leeuwenhoekii]|uniref:hypothetical protein n=1 Tax=Streptomyces leeuwenhoekii TaxID=1437453 RepID=UPI0036901BC6